MSRRGPSLWLAVGISVGAAIHDSLLAVVLGAVIAIAPWFTLGLVHAAIWFDRWAWQEVYERARVSPVPHPGGER